MSKDSFLKKVEEIKEISKTGDVKKVYLNPDLFRFASGNIMGNQNMLINWAEDKNKGYKIFHNSLRTRFFV